MDCNDKEKKFHRKDTRATSKHCKVYNKPKVHHEEGSTSSKTYVCEFCNKTFSSGKVLGGHKRIHIQALKKEGLAKTKQSCDVCKKDFSSKKALYGHLRSHPKREWRGVHSKKYDNYDDDQDQYFLGEPEELVIDDESKSWSPKSFKMNKRGRTRVFVFDDEAFIGAQTLMCISRGQGFHDNIKNIDIEKRMLLDIDETQLRNENNKRMKLMMKLKNQNQELLEEFV
ncbi:hypothetical protein KIW84_020654 [Lathyrus oleraceus]|uniref:C2H2-type domain-containing protein n=1 Tax=Pisum sativum TaxID=3888 RepID=A0A9D4Y7Q4_PEA|nr:hypothetical protein KIW84_020654 [Pisum sativum]